MAGHPVFGCLVFCEKNGKRRIYRRGSRGAAEGAERGSTHFDGRAATQLMNTKFGA
jgi:hypothetical protein